MSSKLSAVFEIFTYSSFFFQCDFIFTRILLIVWKDCLSSHEEGDVILSNRCFATVLSNEINMFMYRIKLNSYKAEICDVRLMHRNVRKSQTKHEDNIAQNAYPKLF